MADAETLGRSVFGEMSLSSEMRELVREHLKADFEDMRKSKYCWDLWLRWISGRETSVIALNDLSVPNIGSGDTLKYFCNKPTSLYCFLPEGLYHTIGPKIFGCLFKQWFACHGNKPRLDFGHFFSNQLSVKPTGPKSIAEIVQMHIALCGQVMSTLESDERLIDSRRQYILLPLCRAIIIVVDETAPLPIKKLDASMGALDWIYDLDQLAQLQTVLMVLTGISDGLSAPINFDDIEPRCKLRVDRSDVQSTSTRDVVRVSIVTAVRFITDLLKRENHILDTQKYPQPHDESLDLKLESDPNFISSSAESYADKILDDADKWGVDNVPQAQEAVDQVRRGEVFDDSGWFMSRRLGI